MPDENSNLNLPAAARRPAARRRGRRGGRGRPRVPRPPNASAPAEIPATELVTPETEVAPGVENNFPAEPAEKLTQIPTAKTHEPAPERAPRPERTERHPEPPRQKSYVKPADFRPAESSAISQAVAHANEIVESLRHMHERLEEVLELVEIAERQKLADERELDELRRALRRIQPPRSQPPFRHSHREEPRRAPEPREPHRPSEETSSQSESEEPPQNPNAEE